MLKVTAAPSGEAEANRVRLSPFLLVHSARPSRASDSAVLRETRAKWPAASLIDFSLLAGVCFIGIQIGEPGGHVTNPPQTRTHTHTTEQISKSPIGYIYIDQDWRPFTSHPTHCSGTETRQPACGATIYTDLLPQLRKSHQRRFTPQKRSHSFKLIDSKEKQTLTHWGNKFLGIAPSPWVTIGGFSKSSVKCGLLASFGIFGPIFWPWEVVGAGGMQVSMAASLHEFPARTGSNCILKVKLLIHGYFK